MPSLIPAATKAAALFNHLGCHPKTALVLVANEKEAHSAADAAKLRSFTPYELSDLRADVGSDLRSFQEELSQITESLSAFYRSDEKQKLLIAPINTAAKYLPDAKLYKTHRLSFGDTIDTRSFSETLLGWGYSLVDVVEQKGEASIRGEVIDIFSPGFEEPLRVLLFDDQIESLRFFDLITQKTDPKEHESIDISPALFALEGDLFSRLSEQVAQDSSDAFFHDVQSLGFWHLKDLDLGISLPAHYKAVRLGDLQEELDLLYEHNPIGLIDRSSIEAAPIAEAEGWEPLAPKEPKTLFAFHQSSKPVTLILSHESQLKQHQIEPGEAKLFYSDSSLSLIGPEGLYLSLNKPQKRKRRRRPTLLLDELKTGDYVVHESYGVGHFEGLSQVNILGGVRDFVTIGYQGEDKLLLPVENLHLIDRFVGESGMVPSLDRLGKGSFARVKEGVKKKLMEIASEIVRRAAERELSQAPTLDIQSTSLESFQADAGFEYTDDQARSIAEILSDLASGKPMDRLLSGDVGFGKTEVAMNAIFAAVQAGMQAALIAPTTLLSSQHFKSLKERFKPYNLHIARLDRFTGPTEKRAALKGLEDGTIQVAVGTHALLGTPFKNLGLMVVDEEHRFGVKQKETLKAKAKDLHLLSMSATPIPRSLNMAMSQIKGFSQIMTPPVDREDVRTFVKESDDRVIKEAIYREIKRGGQCFYVFNRIAGIEQKKRQLENLLPGVRILVLHSKIDSAASEKELLRFAEREYDLLLSTTIIESGIHMPNVNTILIDGADRFGMADLHQLRGRVGRSRRQGYCYFLVADRDRLTEEAKKRLLALESNSFLGSGSVLAFHDLEIRGGGNILGADQSGHIKHIGYGLYLKMLEESLAELMGKREFKHEKPVEIRLSIKAYLSPECIEEERLRLELYRRFARAQDLQSVYELEEEMADRFGTLDETTKQFVELCAIKVLATNADIATISSFQQNIQLIDTAGEKTVITAASKDDDDVIAAALSHLKTLSSKSA